jgi:S-DNA-T family DNA segregation ATPase FtsK/SpoIIIE
MNNRILIFSGDKYIETAMSEGESAPENAVVMPRYFTAYSIKGIPMISISTGAGAHIRLPGGDIIADKKKSSKENEREGTDLRCNVTADSINILSGNPYLNGKRVEPDGYRLLGGDRLFYDGIEMYFGGDHIGVRGEGYVTSLPKHISQAENLEDFPEYTRSPRIIKREPIQKVELTPPPKKAEKKKGELAKLILPPLGMMAVTGAMSVVMGRGIMVLMAVGGTLVSLVVSITNFFQNRKETATKEKERRDAYEKYLLEQQQILASSTSRFVESRRYHNPAVAEIAMMAGNYSSRIYERRSNDADFLQLSLGTSECNPSFEINAKLDDVEYKNDHLYVAMKDIYTEFKTIKDVPVVIDLKNAHLGIVGESEYIHNQLFAIITQLCFLQSYHDMEIITLVSENSRNKFDWIRWFPHCKVRAINVSGLISGENQRDQVLGNLAQVFKMRKLQKDESKREGLYSPHYVFVIEEPKLLINHSIMEYLQAEVAELGYSMVYTTNQLSNLPENIKTILLLDSGKSGRLLLREGTLEKLPLKTNDINNVNLKAIARRLAPLIHNKGVTSQIPESITFFGLYGVKKPEEIPVAQLWKKNSSHKSLAVPLGVRGKDDVVYLNLHEKAHGPHGLVAGTTGSGKSEILQSYILSLAVNFHPYEVGFLLIDYKGGGMANLFKDLPHLLGTITNLDGSESMRALASIQAENRRRQRVFGEVEVNNISQYTKLFKAGEVSEPMPHLFIISDEFAELKKEQPEFMKELVSTARIGRSLGVHLILATQKPSGVVDDQIWSNSKFKLALKVANESDSNEVIKTPDAARITQPGRAILQVGNNEIYEMFQSAFSGASYSEEQVEKSYDGRVYMINDLGQGVLLNQDLSDTGAADNSKVTQLDAVVSQINQTYQAMNLSPVAKPWLPPLQSQIVSVHIGKSEFSDTSQQTEIDCRSELGLVDVPEQQAQIEYAHDFLTDGNLAVFGASGYGKSTVLTQVALSLSLKNSPELLHYYILDLGNSSLIPLKNLPHTADYLSFDDTEKLKKLLKLLVDEISLRKKLFARESAINFKMYNSVADEKLPVILFLIDNYDVVREMGMETEDIITKLTRDGVGLGIFTIITASRSSAVRFAVLNNFKNKICNFMFDQSEIISIIGRSQYTLPEVKGRAIIKLKELNEPAIMQEYLPAPFEDEISYSTNISAIVGKIAESCSADKARGIPMLPDVLVRQELMAVVGKHPKGIAVGLDTDEVQPQFIPYDFGKLLVVGDPQTGKTNIIKLIFSQVKDSTVFISDARSGDLHDFSGNAGVTYMFGASDAAEFAGNLTQFIAERQAKFAENGRGMRPRDFYKTLPQAYIIIDDADNFVENIKSVSREVEAAMDKATSVGINIIATTVPSKLRGYDNISKLLKEVQNGIVTGNPGDQNVFRMPMNRGYKPQIDMAFIVENGRQILTMIPKA